MNYSISFRISELPETINEILAMKLRQRLSRKAYWKRMVWALVSSGKPEAPLETAKLTLLRCSSVQPDPDGLVSSFKHIIDGLVVAGILANDRWANIGMPEYRWEYAAPKKGWIRVTVQAIEETKEAK